MTAAGTIGAAEFLAGGMEISVTALDERLGGGSPERRNQRVQLLEKVCGTPILRQKANARRYTTNIADVLVEAANSNLPFETALREALIRRGVILDVPEVVPSAEELRDGLCELHERVLQLEEGKQLQAALIALEQSLGQRLQMMGSEISVLRREILMLQERSEQQQIRLDTINMPWRDRIQRWWSGRHGWREHLRTLFKGYRCRE